LNYLLSYLQAHQTSEFINTETRRRKGDLPDQYFQGANQTIQHWPTKQSQDFLIKSYRNKRFRKTPRPVLKSH